MRIHTQVEVSRNGDKVQNVYSQLGSAWALRPEIGNAVIKTLEALQTTGTLSPRLFELVRLRIAFHNQCRTCMAVRYQPELVPEDLVCSLEKPAEATNLTDAEKAALAFADLFATDHLRIDDSVYDNLRKYFDEGELVELGVICAMCVGTGRLAATWHIVEDLPAQFQAVGNGPVTPWGQEALLRGIKITTQADAAA